MQALTFMVKRLSQTYDPSVICEAEEILSQSNKELFSWFLCQNVTALAPNISLDNLGISSCNLEELDINCHQLPPLETDSGGGPNYSTFCAHSEKYWVDPLLTDLVLNNNFSDIYCYCIADWTRQF